MADASAPTDPAAIIAALVSGLQDHRVVTQLTAVTSCVLFYDYFLTLADEIEYVWRRSWTVASGIYVFLRYYAISTAIVLLLSTFSGVFGDPVVCDRTAHYQGATTVITTAVIEAVVIMRVYALYRGNKLIAGVMAAYVLAQTCVLVYMETMVVGLQLPPTPVFANGCLAGGNPALGNLAILFPLFPSIFDTVAFLLMTWRIWGHARMTRTGLVDVMLKDGTLYFFFLLATNLSFVITYVTEEGELKVMLASFAQTFGVILINRMLVNLRSYYGNEMGGPASDMGGGTGATAGSFVSPGKKGQLNTTASFVFDRPAHYSTRHDFNNFEMTAVRPAYDV